MDWNVIIWLFIMIVILAASFYIPGLRRVWKFVFQATLSEEMVKRIFFYTAERLVKSTKNTLDDLWLKTLKERLLVEERKSRNHA